jgi:tetratricopeptide (TPR) repeat protein
VNPFHLSRHILLALCLWVLPAAAAPAAPSPEQAARDALRDAALSGKVEDLIRARAGFETLATAEPGSALYPYWIAVADWRIVPRLGDDKGAAERWCRDGIAQAGRAIGIDPKFAEAIAIKASLQGLSLQFHPEQMMSLGAEMEEAFTRARAIAPSNPRVLLLDAINVLHKPAFVGGGPDKALPRFVKAQEAFAAEKPAAGAAPDWGRDEAYLWAGITSMRLDDPDAAVGYYRKALEVAPGNGWVRGTLLPDAEKAAAAKPASGHPASPDSAAKKGS